MRRVLVVLAVAVALVPLAAGALQAAPMPTVADAIALVNASRGGAALAEHSDLDAVAQRHAERMAAENRLHHNPSLGREVTGYELVGENVGVGPELAPIHDAFMRSPSHRANILEARFTEIGIGLATSADGSLWIVQVFRQPVAVAAAPAPAPAPAVVLPAVEPPPAPAPAVLPAVEPPPAPAPAPAAPAAAAALEPAPDGVVGDLAAGFVWPARGAEAVEVVRTSAADVVLPVVPDEAVPTVLVVVATLLVVAVTASAVRTLCSTRPSLAFAGV